MYRSMMGAHRSLGCVVGDSHCDKVEEGESNECSNLTSSLIVTNFQGDPNLPLLPGSAWVPDGK